MPIVLKVRTLLFEQIHRDRQPVGGLEGHLAVSRASLITSANAMAGLDAALHADYNPHARAAHPWSARSGSVT